MFQFTAFPLHTYGFSMQWLSFSQPGFPIRISPDRWLCAPSRSFSQLFTSFIGSWCQGIHPLLLLAWPIWKKLIQRKNLFTPSEGSKFLAQFWLLKQSKSRRDWLLFIKVNIRKFLRSKNCVALRKIKWINFSFLSFFQLPRILLPFYKVTYKK